MNFIPGGGDGMIGATLTCAREGCEEKYIKKTHNQKYHDDECCRLATNDRIMKKYYQKKAQRSGAARYCIECETTKLSRYNDSSICGSCSIKSESNLNSSVIRLLDSTTFNLLEQTG